MIRPLAQDVSASPRRGGVTLIEVAISVLIVGGMLVAALTAVGAAGTSQFKLRERQQGLLLAESLLAEILRQPYEDPDGPADGFGLEAGEAGDGSRLLWDDVDDYDGCTKCPPQNKDGSAIPGSTDLKRVVTVQWVNSSNPAQASASPTHVKRIVVEVKREDRLIVRLQALRTSVWEDPAELQGVDR